MSIRVGNVLTVAPADRPQGWHVAQYPAQILRMQDGAGPAVSYSFVAVAVGEGQLTLVPAGPGSGGADSFTIRIRVLSDLVQGQQP